MKPTVLTEKQKEPPGRKSRKSYLRRIFPSWNRLGDEAYVEVGSYLSG